MKKVEVEKVKKQLAVIEEERKEMSDSNNQIKL